MHAIPLDSIVFPEDISIEIASQYKSRDLVEQHVKNLMLVSADDLPPITVCQREQGYVLLDGAHRVERARRLNQKTINAEFVEAASNADLIKRAYLANQSHGLPDKVSRRVDFALWLIEAQGCTLLEAAAIARCDDSSISRRKQKIRRLEPDYQPAENEHLKPLKRLFKALDGLLEYDDANMFEDIRQCLGEGIEKVDDLHELICDLTELYWSLTGKLK